MPTPSRAPRPPKPPPTPRTPRLPRLRLAPVRARESLALDETRSKREGLQLPPFVRWDQFYSQWEWKQGDHITTIGPTKSGKTVLNRTLLDRRDFVVVLGVKNRDPELYEPFQRKGYQLVRKFDPEVPDDRSVYRVLYVPTGGEKQGAEARPVKAKKFKQALNAIYDAGYWCVYCDDVQYMADQLRLGPELEELWMLGRSEGVTVVASSQEPVNIPVMAYGMATHLFLFANRDRYRARRMGELAGVNRDLAEETILRLPPHEFLYINKNTGLMLRSKVLR